MDRPAATLSADARRPTLKTAPTHPTTVRPTTTRGPRTVLAVLLLAAATPLAHASGDDWGLNGTFRAQSLGNYAQTNESYRGEQTVTSTWTITSTCTNPTDCTGHISSDQGWSAPIYEISGLWNIKRLIKGWEPCPDGTTADGLQNYRFYPVNARTAQQDPTQSNLFAGIDETKGPSGACSINKPLVISLPFKMTRISGR